jgi:hypothetical protein
MAQAHGYHGPMDYARFSYTAYDAELKTNRDGMPPLDLQFNPESFTPEDITEDYTIEVDDKVYRQALEVGEIVIDDTPYIRFIDRGDRVTLACDGKSVTYTVHNVVKDKDLTEEDITKNEKAMHNRGYMKGPDTQTEGADKSNVARNQSNHLRRIVTTQRLESNKEYWIRFRAVDEAGKEFMFDYLELCPKSVYDNPLQKEDRH